MIDFGVAYDKLAQFETSDEIAEFLKFEGVKAKVGDTRSCAISVWMKNITGLGIRTNFSSVRAVDETQMIGSRNIEGLERSLTVVLRTFVSKFDNGWYPELLQEDYR